MKFHLKKDGIIRFTRNENKFDDLLNKGELYQEGWRTAQQLLELGLLQDGRQTREVVDREATLEEMDKDGNIVNPAKEMVVHVEYFVPANYSIEIEDTSAQEAQDALDKAERDADLVDIKKMIQNVKDSTKPAWEKKLLIRLIKDTK